MIDGQFGGYPELVLKTAQSGPDFSDKTSSGPFSLDTPQAL
jgi:hypothetical protein